MFLSFRAPALAGLVLLISALSGSGTAQAGETGDPVAGAKIFKRCSVCHREDADESRRGPLLEGVVGRQAATAPGYPFSDAMRAAGAEGLVWDEEHLARFLKKPQAMVRGTWMAFAGIGKRRDMLDLIAYLREHHD